MDLSFVILTWNSEKQIKKCLRSIFDDLYGKGLMFEIFIVDNGSTDDTVQIVELVGQDYPEHISIILLEKNMGTTYSRNIALKRAKGRFIVTMDSDVEVHPGVIITLIEIIRQNDEIGIIAPRLEYADGRLQKSTDVFPTVFTKFYRYFFLKLTERKEHRAPDIAEIIEVDYAISAMWVLRRELLETVGYLDEKIFYSPEDVDYCMRVWKAGWKIAYTPMVSCIHHAQEISRGIKINRATLHHIQGLLYYFFKHNCLIVRPDRNILKKNSERAIKTP